MNQLRLFRIALMYFTRIPVGEIKDFQTSDLNHASRYFTWVGALVGAINAAVFVLANLVFDQPVAVVLAMAVSFVLTGCFHEDGLADAVDGFGGGYTVARKLAIMKDSRQGTYGVVALWTALMLKWLLLSRLDAALVPLVLVIGHVFSRFVPVLMIKQLSYVRDENSKAKPLANQSTWGDVAIAALIMLPALALRLRESLILAVGLVIAYLLLARLTKRQIGGYTGDVLGATQQVCELLVYAVWVAAL